MWMKSGKEVGKKYVGKIGWKQAKDTAQKDQGSLERIMQKLVRKYLRKVIKNT